jgi:hypothetical protein
VPCVSFAIVGRRFKILQSPIAVPDELSDDELSHCGTGLSRIKLCGQGLQASDFRAEVFPCK